jgi:hypothetical protein
MSYTQEFLNVLFEANPVYTKESILDFKSLPEGTPTTAYSSFIYQNVSDPKNPFRIEPFELFLLKTDEPNAFAFEKDGLYIIGIHLSLFKLPETKIRKKVPLIKEPALSLITKVEKCTPLRVDFLMYQFITLFTYYHELAHLNQLRHAGKNSMSLFEKYNLVEGKEFDRISHAMEIDADLFATQQVTFHVLQYWSDFAPEQKNKENLEAFISMVSASIFLFFFELTGGWQDLYLLEYDHPHPLIRISYITDAIANLAAEEIEDANQKPSKEKCVLDALIIAQQLLTNGKQDGLHEYIQIYKKYQQDIGDYVKKEMGPFSKSLDFLIPNWYNK